MKYIAVVGPYTKFVDFIHKMDKRVSINRRTAVNDDLTYEAVYSLDHIQGIRFTDLMQLEKGGEWDVLAEGVKARMHP